jgi:hypothetical protein
MKCIYQLLLCLSVTGALIADGPKKIYPHRWVSADGEFSTDKHLDELVEIARTSAAHGLTGVVLSGMDRISLWPAGYVERLKRFKQVCDQLHLEIIPAGFKTGYGGAILAHDKNLAEGMLVENALFLAGDKRAKFVPDSPLRLANGGFEESDGGGFAGFALHADSGTRAVVDTSIFHSGRVSLRLENDGNNPDSTARLQQEIRVTPNRCYRVSAWVRTEKAGSGPLLSFKTFTADHRDLSPYEPPMPATTEWTRVSTAFNSWYADRIQFNVGVFEGVPGKVWVDDVQIEEVGLLNVLRRDGTPLAVRDDKTGAVYEEGRDFVHIADPNLDFHWTHEMPEIQLIAGGRIRPGTRLRVDYYHGTTIYNDQASACPSERRIWEIWKEQFPLVEKYVAPKKYFLSLDEMRLFNRCAACKRRHLSPAEMIKELTRGLYSAIRDANPSAQVFVWSDMFDPNHNAVPKYFLVDGDPVDTWKFLPKDIGIVCWYYEKRRASLDFFSSHGFKTIAAAYYDADDLKNPQEWLEALDATPGASGIMYTTFAKKFGLLAPFGDLVSKR